MERKSFFKERSISKMREMDILEVGSPSGLVERLISINPLKQVVQIDFPLVSQRYRSNFYSSAQTSRKCYKHGNYVNLRQPRSLMDAREFLENPEKILRGSLGFLERKKEEDIDVVGYAFRAVQGRDRRKRLVPFVWIFEGAKLFNYAENKTSGIEIVPYDDARRVAIEGAEIICKVPSRTKKQGRYILNLEHVPVIECVEKNALIWGLKSNFSESPLHKSYNFRYTRESSNEGSDVSTFYPHEIAAYFGVIKSYLQRGVANNVPLKSNPFMIPSRYAVDFYKIVCNNLMIKESDITGEKVRRPHLAEKSILVARGLGVLGIDKLFYKNTGRDGKIVDYNWDFSES